MKKGRFGSASFRLKAGLRTFRFWRWPIRFIGVIGAATVPWRLCAFTRNGLPYSGGGSRQGAKTQRPPRRNAHTTAPSVRLVEESDEGQELPIAQLISGDDPLGDCARNEANRLVRQAALALPARYREVIVLCDFRELSYAEAALGRTMTARPASCPTHSVIRTSEDKQTGGRNPGHPEF